MFWQEAGFNRDIPSTLAQRWAATVLQTSAAFSSQEKCYNGLQDLIIRQKSVDECRYQKIMDIIKASMRQVDNAVDGIFGGTSVPPGFSRDVPRKLALGSL